MPCSNNTSDLSEAVRRDDQKAHAGPAAIAIRESSAGSDIRQVPALSGLRAGWTKWITGRFRIGSRTFARWAGGATGGGVCVVGWAFRDRRDRPRMVDGNGRLGSQHSFGGRGNRWGLDHRRPSGSIAPPRWIIREDINLDVAREIAMAGYGIDNQISITDCMSLVPVNSCGSKKTRSRVRLATIHINRGRRANAPTRPPRTISPTAPSV